MRATWLLPLPLLCLSVIGCGGSLNEPPSETGGASSGGASSGGAASGGSPGSGGDAAGGGGYCCLLLVTCAEGDVTIGSEADCPTGASCYSNSGCCQTIWCAHLPDACDPPNEPERTYVATSPEECSGLTFECAEDSSSFSNDCGCGCEPCPEYFDCAPVVCDDASPDCVPGTDPRCASTECPNTLRAY